MFNTLKFLLKIAIDMPVIVDQNGIGSCDQFPQIRVVVFVLKKILLKQNKSHSRSLNLHIVYVNEDLPE